MSANDTEGGTAFEVTWNEPWEQKLTWRHERWHTPYVISPLGFDVMDQVIYACQLAFHRQPTTDELAASHRFFVKQLDFLTEKPVTNTKDTIELQAITNFCHVLLISNEFLYLD